MLRMANLLLADPCMQLDCTVLHAGSNERSHIEAVPCEP